MSPLPSIGIAIPAFRNIDNLRRCLLSIGTIAPELSRNIHVVDDSGSGEVAAALRTDFPSVVWSVHPANRGFGPSANEAVLGTPAEIVILLNDDVELVTDPTRFVHSAFSDASLFAASFQSRQSDGTIREGAKRLVWRMGMPKILHNPKDQYDPIDDIYRSDYAVGGHAAYRKDRFIELGGFDPLFSPFYWEDVDICMRARRRGWQTIYIPECVVTHHESGAIRSSHDEQAIREAVMRNRLLFAWRHLPIYQKPQHYLALLFRWLASGWNEQSVFRKAYSSAKKRA